MNTPVFTKAAAVSTIVQVIMVLVNHFAPTLFGPMLPPIGGTGVGAAAGAIYGLWAKGGTIGGNALGGAATGAAGGVLGAALSMALGDVPVTTLAVAGASTAVSGAIGGVVGRSFGPRS